MKIGVFGKGSRSRDGPVNDGRGSRLQYSDNYRLKSDRSELFPSFGINDSRGDRKEEPFVFNGKDHLSEVLRSYDKRLAIPRPNTALRRHVKKISQDFSTTQMLYRNHSKEDDILVEARVAKTKKSAEEKFGAPLSAKATGRNTNGGQAHHCSKCSFAKCPRSMVPLEVVVRAEGSGPGASDQSLLKVSSKACSLKHELFPPTPPPPPSASRLKQRRTPPEGPNAVRAARRRRSQSASAGFSTGVLKVPFEQVKKAKLFAERAVKEGKVFAIHGAFPGIREALLKRGWVEKMLHTIPYVNPHPQNCVCTYTGCHPASTNSHQHSNQNTPTTDSATEHPTSSTDLPNCDSLEREDHERVEPDPELRCEPGAHDEIPVQEDWKQCNETFARQEEEESENHLITNDDESCNSSKSPAETPSPPATHEANPDENACPVIPEEKEYCDAEEVENFSNEYLHKISKTLNTAFLGPSEIREGIHKSITKNNLSIFQYSIPPYVKKARSLFPSFPDKDPKLKQLSADLEAMDRNSIELELESGDDLERAGHEEDKMEEETGIRVKSKAAAAAAKPFNPFPELDYNLTSLDKPVVARVLRNVEPNFIWSWNRDSISFKHLSKEQLVNRFPNTPFTTKYGLCETLKQLQWFSETARVDTFVPRAYCIGHEDERSAFVHDYRTTACLNILKWITDGSSKTSLQAVAHPMGEVPVRRVRQALQHVERFIQTCCHDDLDAPSLSPLKENEWELLINAHNRMVHQGKKVKALAHHVEALVRDCQSALDRARPFWPQLTMDGVRNVWIVKPGAQSRGRGIFLLNHLDEILALVQSPLIYQTKYVVQKYMERPLLIWNTKFDIRQWFLVTDWNPLTLWMYRPWLIEINSSPCMASTTSVTKRMCYESLCDTIKVVVDYKANKSADTGKFELIYQDKEKSVATIPYYGVTLQVVGRQIWRSGSKSSEGRRVKKHKTAPPKVTKSIPLISLRLGEEELVGAAAKLCPFLHCQSD